MSLFTGPMHFHLDGHKDLTIHNDQCKKLDPDTVWFPLYNGVAPCTSLVGTSTLAKLQNSRKWLNSRFFRVKTPKKIVVSMLYGVALYDIMVLYEVIVHETQL